MSFFKQLSRRLQGKRKISVSIKHLQKGRLDQRKYNQICKRVESIIDNFSKVKIGETANPKKRITFDDYLDNYGIMYLLYQSKNIEEIHQLEVDLIDDFYEDIGNIKDTRGGMMKKVRGATYYIYIVAEK